jgi:hypothetical protein
MRNAVPPDRLVFVLLDETQPTAILPLVSEAFVRLRSAGLEPRLLSIPCPDQPAHPLAEDTGPYHPWLLPGLPPHRAVIATSVTTALLALCDSQAVYWLLDADPVSYWKGSPFEQDLARRLLSADALTPLVTYEATAAAIRAAGGVSPIVWPLLRLTLGQAPGKGVVLDHLSARRDSLVLAAEAFAGSSIRPVVLTELLEVPSPDAFGRTRSRPFQRGSFYDQAAVIVKLDSFHENRPLLARMMSSGATIVTTREALGQLPARPAEHLWFVSDPDNPTAIRQEVERLVANQPVRAAFRERAQAAARSWSATPIPSWEPPHRRNGGGNTASRLAPLLTAVLQDSRSAAWNRTLLRMLQCGYDKIRGARQFNSGLSRLVHRFDS